MSFSAESHATPCGEFPSSLLLTLPACTNASNTSGSSSISDNNDRGGDNANPDRGDYSNANSPSWSGIKVTGLQRCSCGCRSSSIVNIVIIIIRVVFLFLCFFFFPRLYVNVSIHQSYSLRFSFLSCYQLSYLRFHMLCFLVSLLTVFGA